MPWSNLAAVLLSDIFDIRRIRWGGTVNTLRRVFAILAFLWEVCYIDPVFFPFSAGFGVDDVAQAKDHFPIPTSATMSFKHKFEATAKKRNAITTSVRKRTI